MIRKKRNFWNPSRDEKMVLRKVWKPGFHHVNKYHLNLARGGGLVVSALDYCSKGPNSILVGFSVVLYQERQNKQKRGQVRPTFKNHPNLG